AARYVISTTLSGFPVEYEERPFEWVYPKRFKILRKMRSGPIDALEVTFHLEPTAESGTKVRIAIGFEPRYRILAPILKVATSVSLRDFEQAITREDAALQAGTGPALPVRRGAVHADALARAEKALRESDRGPRVEKLLAYLRDAADADVSRIRPFALA